MKRMSITMDLYSEIRIRHTVKGESIRKIARDLHVSRQTVQKYCKGETHPEQRKEYKRDCTVMTDQVKDFILACLRSDEEEGIKKQRHTAKRIYDRLVAEMEFSGSYSTVRAAVSELRAKSAVPPRADIPLEFSPGEATQIDWGEVTAYLGKDRLILQMFCGRLCMSADLFVQVYYRANQESFLEAQQKMFDFQAGISDRLIFDNAKIAVKNGFGKQAIPQDRYHSFLSHYAVSVDFCNPGAGNEKGLVENLVGYAQHNFFVPIPHAENIEALNEELLNKCLAYRTTHKIEGRHATVAEMYEMEKTYLHPIPPYRYETCRKEIHRVNDYALVRFDTNSYSVPVQYVGQSVTIQGYANRVNILHNDLIIATYERSYNKNQIQFNLSHYLCEIERKPRCVFNAKPVRQTVQEELLNWGKQLPGGHAEMIRLLRLCVTYGEDKILSLYHSLPPDVPPTVDAICSLLHDPEKKEEVVCIDNEIEILEVDPSVFDRICGVSNQ